MAPIVIEGIEKALPLIKLWDAEDPDRALTRLAPDIRAIATGGHSAIDGPFMSRFPKLEIVANFGVGYDSVDAAWAGRHGIVVTNTPGVLDEEVADTAMALVLATVRQLPAAERHLRAGRWLEGNFPLTSTLRGRTLGILGLGRIGKAIASRAEAFGLSVVYHNRRPQPDVPYLYYPTLKGLAEASDILVVVTPGGAGTRNLVDAEVLEALGTTGALINIARGTVVDEEALVAALRQGTIAAAGLDVFADEPRVPQALIDMDHVVLLPHVGSASQHTRDAMGQLVVDNLLSWTAGKGPLTPVVETPWPARAKTA
ncbi:MAG TPA: 2-hydroxyacid dehydrogenase [Lichenihabitans sp.]|jgi:lactate dehydrogenase-like 2-hydroxyacid dehydrogenase|nr:2-hydroxyacid dehydrogenase [Lichenihabitans sp.]